jgi:hypothetical protein
MRQATQVALVNRVLDDVDRNTTEVNRNAISTSTCAPIMPSLTRRAISHGLPVQGFAGLQCADHSLVRIPVAERHDLIWVRVTPGPDFDVGEPLGGLGPEMASHDLGGYSHYKTQTLTKAMNWSWWSTRSWRRGTWPRCTRATVGPIFQPNVTVFDALAGTGASSSPGGACGG